MKQRLVFSALMSFVLSFLMTLWVTWINLGLVDGFAGYWFQAFVLAWPAAALISFITAPSIQYITQKIVTTS